MAIDPTSSTPLAQQLADHLRDRIRSGELPPGQPLPSRADLMEEHGVSSTTARAAVDVLRDEGLVWSAGGRRVFVRAPVAQRVVSSHRYRQTQETGRAGFVERHGIRADEWTMDPCRFTTLAADEDVAGLLGIAVGDRVLQRYQVLRARGLAEEIRYGYFPLWLVDGTAFTDPARQPFPGGVLAELTADELGVDFRERDALIEHIRARPATPEEARVLRLPDGWGVLVSDPRLVFDSQDRPVAAERIVYPADRTVIEVHIDIGDDHAR